MESNQGFRGLDRNVGFLARPENWYGWFAELIADKSSPILVKEVRQAFNGRVFFFSFHLYLLALLVIALYILTLDTSFITFGRRFSYAVIQLLAFPLLAVVPILSFRSLAGEYEGDTLQLVSITALDAGRIINGKLGCSLLQIVIFLAAALPALVFCFIFEMVDIVGILYKVGFLALSSFGLCCCTQLFASASKKTLFLFGTQFLSFAGCLAAWYGSAISPLINEQQSLFADSARFFQAAVAYTLFILMFSNFFRCCTIANVSFWSDNKVTRIRVSFFVILLTYLWCSTWVILSVVDEASVSLVDLLAEGLTPVFVIANFCIGLFGALSAVENKMISNRVRRELQRSGWARAITIFLKPGPGKGYMFSWLMILALNFSSVFFIGISYCISKNDFSYETIVSFAPVSFVLLLIAVINSVYAIFFMSIGYLCVATLKWFTGHANIVVAIFIVVASFFVITFCASSLYTVAQTRSDFPIEKEWFDSFIWVRAFDRLNINRSSMALNFMKLDYSDFANFVFVIYQILFAVALPAILLSFLCIWKAHARILSRVQEGKGNDGSSEKRFGHHRDRKLENG